MLSEIIPNKFSLLGILMVQIKRSLMVLTLIRFGVLVVTEWIVALD